MISKQLLKDLNVNSNAGITALALGYNTALEGLDASNTGLTDLDLSANILIQALNVASAPITNLNIVNNSALSSVNTSCCASLISTEYSNSSVFLIGSVVIVDHIQYVVFQTSKIVSNDEITSNWSNASSWCTSHGTGWYFADINTMQQLYNSKMVVNVSLSSISSTPLGTGDYWSSSQGYATGAMKDSLFGRSINFSSGAIKAANNDKNNTYQVRAVRDF